MCFTLERECSLALRPPACSHDGARPPTGAARQRRRARLAAGHEMGAGLARRGPVAARPGRRAARAHARRLVRLPDAVAAAGRDGRARRARRAHGDDRALPRRDRARADQAPERRARHPRHVGHRAAERGGVLRPGRDHQQHRDAARDARADGRAGPRPAGHDRRGRGRGDDPVPARDAVDREGQGAGAGAPRPARRDARGRAAGDQDGQGQPGRGADRRPDRGQRARPRPTSASAPPARRRWRGRSPGPACSWRSS